jgi:hypothetical protein
MKKWIFFFLSFLLTLLALPGDLLAQSLPSSISCGYYQSLESELQCGPSSYISKWAGPMCEKYLEHETNPWKALFLTSELKAWFPRVRLCLQQKLEESKHELSCAGLNDFAKSSHVECYIETNYCDLSPLSQIQLGRLSATALVLDTTGLWQETLLGISEACLILHSDF